ncbi:MAG: CsgG/HfaB family protein [Spirochaetota bacterium]
MIIRLLLIPIIVLSMFIAPSFATTIAISDLEVQSANPNYKFIGKGVAELISFELSKSKNVTVISREKRAEMLKEVEFAMLTDEQQIKMGKMLAAQYIVSGSIIDMAEAFIITVKLIDVQTGKVVWQDKLTEKISKYDYISAYFAQGILKSLNAMADTTTIAKVERKQEKDEKAVVALSKAVDSLDKNDTEKARTQLQKAKSYDPENDLIKEYMILLHKHIVFK